MTQPNIVFILSDDLGWNDLGAGGSTYYDSPNIDRIAHEGINFTQGYANCQVCSPSRASILTGQDTPRHGITNYIGAAEGEEWRKGNRHDKLLPPAYRRGLDKATKIFPQVLREAGYRTFFAGKWHLGEEGSWPEDFGFEINKGGWSVGQPKGGYFSPYDNPRLEKGDDGECLPLRLGEETASFIRDHKDEPFLAYLSFYSVHAPIQTSKERWEKYRQKALEKPQPENRFIFDRNLPVRQVQDCPIYAGMIEAMDDAVGIVLDALDELGLAENTIVCFTSDNGGVSSGDAFASSMLPLRGGKGRQWEGGIREPYYIRFPKAVKPGSTSDVPVTGTDYYPTFLELAGVDLPEGQVFDGESIVPLLRGEDSDVLNNRDLFWHYPHYGNQGGDPSSIIRSGHWKLIHYYEDGRNELYHLERDIGEQNDVSAENEGLVKELQSKLNAWLKETGASFPVPDPEYDADKQKERLDRLAGPYMEKLEKQHAAYLEADWEPDPTWWGSNTTID
jgi:arylsulfatase A-like enzyme